MLCPKLLVMGGGSLYASRSHANSRVQLRSSFRKAAMVVRIENEAPGSLNNPRKEVLWFPHQTWWKWTRTTPGLSIIFSKTSKNTFWQHRFFLILVS
jgi:hypothetical protein